MPPTSLRPNRHLTIDGRLSSDGLSHPPDGGIFNIATETARARKTLTEQIIELKESQAHTDERLNAFIDIVERDTGEGRNGAEGAHNKFCSEVTCGRPRCRTSFGDFLDKRFCASL